MKTNQEPGTGNAQRSCLPVLAVTLRQLISTGLFVFISCLGIENCAAQYTLSNNAVWASAAGRTAVVMRAGSPVSSGIRKRMQAVVDHDIADFRSIFGGTHHVESSTSFQEDGLRAINTWTNRATDVDRYYTEAEEVIHWKQKTYRTNDWYYQLTGDVVFHRVVVTGPPDVVTVDDWLIPDGYQETMVLMPDGTLTALWGGFWGAELAQGLLPIALGSGANRADAIVPLGGYSFRDIAFLAQASDPDQKIFMDPPFAAGFDYWVDAAFPERIKLIDLPPGFGSVMEILTPTIDGGPLVSRGMFPTGDYDLRQLSGRTNGVKRLKVQGLNPQADLSLDRPFAIGMVFEGATNDIIHLMMRPFTGTVRPGPISLERTSGNVTLRWSGDFMLHTADSVNGPWTDLPGAASGFQLSPSSPCQFFRLRSK